ncbi:MAG: DUF4443 domain-containing protein [Candidatus Ranarchaeia archaeon]
MQIELLRGEKGPRAQYSEIHAILVLYHIKQNQILGRYQIQKILNLKDSSTRTLLSHLKKGKYISSIKNQGHILTPKGKRFIEKIQEKIIGIHNIELENLSFGKYQILLHFRGKLQKKLRGIEERDIAIKAGANGSVTIRITQKGMNILETDIEFKKNYPKDYDRINEVIKTKIGDVLFICSADLKSVAFFACFSIAIDIMGDSH